MKVSILLPVYSVEDYIERCARSLFSQTYEDLEFVFVDDCSQDHSIDVVEKVIKDYPQRGGQLKIVRHQQNKGVAGTRNTALNNASGDFVMWVDPDDYIESDFVHNLMLKQRETNADVVVGGYDSCYVNGKNPHYVSNENIVSEYLKKVLRRETSTALWGKIWKRDIYTDNDLHFIEGCNMDEDGHIIARYLYFAQSIAFVDVIGYHYDCSRPDNFSNGTFNVSKYEKAWLLYDDLNSFFVQRNAEYLNDLRYWKINLLTVSLMNSAKSGDAQDFFKKTLKERYISDDKRYMKNISILRRFAYFSSSYRLNCFYYRSMAWIKHKMLRQNVTEG